MDLLKVTGLSIAVGAEPHHYDVVEDVSFDVQAGQTLAIVGESGCGKSMTALALMRLLPDGVGLRSGRIVFDGQDLADLPERSMSRLRGASLSLISQDPMSSLNPLVRIGEQISESLRIHHRAGRRAADARALELLQMVGISDAATRIRQFPYELSGGMRQRVMIASAMACRPRLMIADEPTTALDVTVQAQILMLLKELQRQTGMALVLITHDFGVVAQMADRVAVMYAGRVVEEGPVAHIFESPRHPYTRGLLACSRQQSVGDGAVRRGQRLEQIAGKVAALKERSAGCGFAPRCGQAVDICRQRAPGLVEKDEGGKAACWLAMAETSHSEDRMGMRRP